MLEQGESELAKGDLSGASRYLRASGVFNNALEAAGLAAAAEEPEATVRKYLRSAAKAAPLIFHAGGAKSTVTELTAGDMEELMDTSDASPWTLVRALYAAVASGEKDVERELAHLPVDAYHTDQVIMSAVADRYTRALQLLLAGDPEAARESSRPRRTPPSMRDRKDRRTGWPRFAHFRSY